MARKRPQPRKNNQPLPVVVSRRRQPVTAASQAGLAAIVRRARQHPRALSPHDVQQLQRTMGNRAVGRLLAPPLDRQPQARRQTMTKPDRQRHRRQAGGVRTVQKSRTAEPGRHSETWNKHKIEAKSSVEPAHQIAIQKIRGKRDEALTSPSTVQRQLGRYLLDVGSSFAWYLKSVIADYPKHIWRLLKHLTVGLGVTLFDMGAELVRALAAGFGQGQWGAFAKHLGKAFLKEPAAWLLRLVAKVLDTVGFGEAMDLVMQILKFNTRSLNGAEITAAQTVFGNSINYGQVRVDEYSLLNTYVFHFWLAFTSWHTINFPGGSNFTTDPGTFIHELTHVWQMERRGTQYIAEAPIHGGLQGAGYVYAVDRDPGNNANGVALAADRGNGKTIWSFNLEQQSEICRHFYMRQQAGLGVAQWQPYINDIQGINSMPWRVWLREPAFTKS